MAPGSGTSIEGTVPVASARSSDWGPQGGHPPYCNDLVTRDRCMALRQSGRPNGVGWTQLTSLEYVDQARALGGEWIVRYQCRVGFEVLKGHIAWGGESQGFGAYNGGRGNPIESYASSCLALKKQWESRIANALRSGRFAAQPAAAGRQP